ncbi:MAG: Uncharacterized protein G01um101431_435 [Parcubacteria group bacterium Gr01-1014_31]|nr:MAG: Uncharacterized protein G01um101431_435 [Parcubacteria group bacterium Gr01-1014_31]
MPLRKGFSAIEALLAFGIFTVVASAVLTVALGATTDEQRQGRMLQARAFAVEGLEAARSIRDHRFLDLAVGDHGLTAGGGAWAFSGTQETVGGYTRKVQVGPVYRLAGGTGALAEATDAGASIDPSSRYVTAAVSWLTLSGPQSVTLTTLLTQWSLKRWLHDVTADFTAGRRNSLQVTVTDDGELQLAAEGNWAAAVSAHTVDIGGVEDASDCTVDPVADVLYVATDARGSGRPELYGYDLADISATTTALYAVATAEIGEDANGLAVQAAHAYFATSQNGQEMMVARLSDGVQLSSWNTPGTNANANDVTASGTVAYLVTDADGGDPEFFAIDITTPASLPGTPLGTAEIGFNSNAVALSADGRFAYVATDGNSEEVVIVRLADYAVVQQLNIGGNGNASDVLAVGNRLYVVKRQDSGAEFYVYDATVPGAIPTSPLSVAELDTNALQVAVEGRYAFVATDAGSRELVAIDLGTLAQSNVNLAGSSTVNSVCAYGAFAYAISRANGAEVTAVRGGATATFAPRGTFTSAPFDTQTSTTAYTTLQWSRQGTGTVQFLLRTADTAAHLAAARWAGVDGTASAPYTVPGQTVTLDPGASGARWIQLRAYLQTFDPTVAPVLEDVSVFYDF